MMPGLKQVIPGISVAMLTLLAALPWGLPSESRFLLPLLPFTAIHIWALRSPRQMPEWLVFMAGLATDALSHGPLGFWSLILLIGRALVPMFPPPQDWGFPGRWFHFCATLLALALAQWVVASAYFMGLVEWQPLARSAFAVSLAYPLLELLFRPYGRTWSRTHNPSLTRGA